MDAVVVGGGLVGSTLAERLSQDGHSVTVVEQSASQLRSLSDHLDVATVHGSGSSVDALRRAGIESCDVLFACTSSDEVNMVVALMGAAIFKVPRVVARLRAPEAEASFQVIADKLPGEHVSLNPELAAVEKILSLLPVPGAVDVSPFLDGRLLIAGFPIRQGSDFGGLLLSHMRLLFAEAPVMVVAIRRGSVWIVPHGDDEIRVGDLVYFALDRAEMTNVLALLGARPTTDRRVLIAGATRIGVAVAQRLEAKGTVVTLVEADEAACREAAATLQRAMVVQGSPTDRALLEEEGTPHAAAFIACTDDHQVNVVASLLARRLGAAHTFALVDDPALSGLVGELGIDAVISPRLLTVGLAAQFVRRGRVRAAAALLEDHVEVVEAEITAGGRLTRGMLRDLALPRGVLVPAILRDGGLLVPRGDDRLQAGDRAVLAITAERAVELDAVLAE